MPVKIQRKELTIPPLMNSEEVNYEPAQVIAYSYTDEDYDDCDNVLPISISQITGANPIKIRIEAPEWVVPIISHRARFMKSNEYVLTPRGEKETVIVYFVSKAQKKKEGIVVIYVGDCKFELKARTCGV